jgi:hypothetical protein
MTFPIYRIPTQSWLATQKLGNDHKHFGYVPVPEDGDCLFHCVRCVFIKTANKTYDVRDLRHVVAKTVLDEDNVQMTDILQSWRHLYQEAITNGDLQFAREYAHMEGITDINTAAREKIFQRMMTRSYWGDEHALRVLEDVCGVRFIVLNSESKNVAFSYRDIEPRDPLVPVNRFILLSLHHRHYEVICFEKARGKWLFAFKEDELPAVIETMCEEVNS